MVSGETLKQCIIMLDLQADLRHTDHKDHTCTVEIPVLCDTRRILLLEIIENYILRLIRMLLLTHDIFTSGARINTILL